MKGFFVGFGGDDDRLLGGLEIGVGSMGLYILATLGLGVSVGGTL